MLQDDKMNLQTLDMQQNFNGLDFNWSPDTSSLGMMWDGMKIIFVLTVQYPETRDPNKYRKLHYRSVKMFYVDQK